MLKSIEVLLIIESEIATTQLITQILEACAVANLTFRKITLDALQAKDIGPFTLPLIVRSCDPSLRPWIIMLKRARHPFVYYIDDNFWAIQGSSALAQYYQHPMVRKTLDDAIRNSQCVLTNSFELANIVKSRNTHVSVLPTFFNFALINKTIPESTKEIRVGFAGSSSRSDDLDIIKHLIRLASKEYPQVVFEFAGVLPSGVSPSSNVRFFPHIDSYEQFINLQASRNWSIGLAPLIDNEANRCKTDNKYREYAACGIAGIYSAVTPYQNAVTHEITGLLIENTEDSWTQAFRLLLSDHEIRSRIAKNALKDARSRYCIQKVSETWASHLSQSYSALLASQAKPIQAPPPLLQMIDKARHYWIVAQISFVDGGVRLVMKRIARRALRALRV